MLVEKIAVKKFLDTYPRELFEESFKIVFNDKLKEEINTQTGIFGADMKVSLLNDGPVTIILESKNWGCNDAKKRTWSYRLQ